MHEDDGRLGGLCHCCSSCEQKADGCQDRREDLHFKSPLPAFSERLSDAGRLAIKTPGLMSSRRPAASPARTAIVCTCLSARRVGRFATFTRASSSALCRSSPLPA